MGREAHFARLVLGRSAFQAPLKDENGEFIHGNQTLKHNNSGYVQRWDERGNPHNSISERQTKKFCDAQNQVLYSCGVVVRRDAERRRRRLKKEVPENLQVEIAKEENEIGFMLNYVESIFGDLLTWWINNLRKRLIVFRPTHPTMLGMVRAEMALNPITFLFGGLVVYATNSTFSASQDLTYKDPSKYADFLETNEDLPTSWKETINLWGRWCLGMITEIPFEILCTLQQLGFIIGPILLDWIKQSTHPKIHLDTTAISGLFGIVAIHLIRKRAYNELNWRMYMLIRQILPRPRRPTTSCIVAAESDEYDGPESIVGIGRSLGGSTDRRFFGPQSFWSAFKIAFPWTKIIFNDQIDREEIKQETLARCLMMETGQEYGNMPEHLLTPKRAENIINNLESLGIDVEEDFYVDIDEWTEDIEFLDQGITNPLHLEIEEMASLDGDEPENESPEINNILSTIQHSTEEANNFTHHHNGSIVVEFQLEQGPTMQTARVEPVSITLPVNSQSAQDNIPAISDTSIIQPENPSEFDQLFAQAGLVDNLFEGMTNDDPISNERNEQLDWETPTTPEPGIRRARSLSHTQTTPRPIRRITETDNDTSVEAYLAEVLDSSRKAEAKKKAKDNRESRITRLSVFAADSLAWHMSTVMTAFIFLPLDVIYLGRLTRWFTSFVDKLDVANSTTPHIIHLGAVPSRSTDWNCIRMIWCSFGIECLIRGMVWQVGCGVARYYGRRCQWGRF